MLLVACGNDKKQEDEELLSLIDTYNNQVDFLLEADDIPSIDKIDKDNLGEFKKEDKLYWQVLLDYEDYNIKAKYDNNKQLYGYNVYSTGEKDFNEQGIVSAITIAKSLGLDVQKYHDNFTTALESGDSSNEYKDSAYEISFLVDHDLNLLVINFDKQE